MGDVGECVLSRRWQIHVILASSWESSGPHCSLRLGTLRQWSRVFRHQFFWRFANSSLQPHQAITHSWVSLGLASPSAAWPRQAAFSLLTRNDSPMRSRRRCAPRALAVLVKRPPGASNGHAVPHNVSGLTEVSHQNCRWQGCCCVLISFRNMPSVGEKLIFKVNRLCVKCIRVCSAITRLCKCLSFPQRVVRVCASLLLRGRGYRLGF